MLQTNHFYSEADLARFRTAYAAMPPHRKLAENRLLAAGGVVVGLLLAVFVLVVVVG
jgi:restriction endonuclease Mrr